MIQRSRPSPERESTDFGAMLTTGSALALPCPSVICVINGTNGPRSFPCPTRALSCVTLQRIRLSCTACFSQPDVSRYKPSNSSNTPCVIARPYSMPVPVLSEQRPLASRRMADMGSRARTLWLPQPTLSLLPPLSSYKLPFLLDVSNLERRSKGNGGQPLVLMRQPLLSDRHLVPDSLAGSLEVPDPHLGDVLHSG